MTREFAPRRLDVAAFAEDGVTLSGHTPLLDFTRLAAETTGVSPDAEVTWTAEGEQRTGVTGAPDAWLHLEADAVVPLVCQRCLAPVDIGLSVDRWFRFVRDEETAAIEDEESEEDILVTSRDFDLHALIEDELLMEIPVTPRHDACPDAPPLSAADADFDVADGSRPNPFAVLGKLRGGKPE
ncbi:MULTISPECIES: DUF177 domain-containing protein [unclassified Variovorax]|uniref:YceD family protein n=1 Tax=unclassified Variovorax TaxID=663243 RepID=UPI001BD2EF32|nr:MULTISPECIES: DUF177 domain-containing protein [unclassified Variovorax]